MLNVTGLSKSFAGRVVFREVAFSLNPGEALTVMGSSGTGKTTLLRCLNGLERADAGTVTVGAARLDPRDGVARFRAAALAVRRRVGFVFQGCHLFSHRTVLENVMEGPLIVRGDSPERARAAAAALLTELGVGHRAAAWPHELSGGEQQR